jgi:hypothetical protein
MVEIIFAVRNVGINKGMKMISLDDLTDQQASQFKTMVDECILENSEIPEMREGLAYIDDLAHDQNISVYDLLLNLYTIVEAVDAIDEWEKDK